MTQFIVQYFNILRVERGSIFDHSSRKKVIIKCFKNIRCNPYILVLKFGFNLIITAVAELCHVQDKETDLTKSFMDVHTFLFCSVLLYFSKNKTKQNKIQKIVPFLFDVSAHGCPKNLKT